jgi:hypothetical protein
LYPAQDKSFGPRSVIYHDPRLGSNLATNMTLSNYHSKTKGEPGLGSNRHVKTVRPKAKKIKWKDSTEPREEPDIIEHWAEDKGAD